jgi:hypothetical protein
MHFIMRVLQMAVLRAKTHLVTEKGQQESFTWLICAIHQVTKYVRFIVHPKFNGFNE